MIRAFVLDASIKIIRQKIINEHEFINLRNKKEQPHELTRPLW